MQLLLFFLQTLEIVIKFVCSTDNLDNLWNDCADNLPDVTKNNYDPTYLQLLIGLDNLLKNEDCVEEDIFKVKDYITFIIDQRLEETISLLKKRIEIMNKKALPFQQDKIYTNKTSSYVLKLK